MPASGFSVFLVSAVRLLPFLALLPAAVAPAAAQQPESAGSCFVSEAVGTIPELLIHLPISRHRIVETVRTYAGPANDLLGYSSDLQGKLAEIDEADSKGGLDKVNLGNFAKIPFQSCYESRIDRASAFVKAIDTKMPDTAELFPTVGDWLAGDPPCKAHQVLKNGIETVSSWLNAIDENIELLTDFKARLKTLSNAIYTAGRALYEGGMRLYGVGLGKFMGTADAWATQGLYLSETLAKRVSGVEASARVKILAAEKTKRRLSEELLTLREAETTTREKFGAQSCDGGVASTQTPSESAKDRIQRLRDRQAENTEGQWRDVNSSMEGQGDSLRRRASDATKGYRQDADRIEAEMLAFARDSMSKTLQDLSRRNAGRYGGGPAANCGDSRRKIAALDEWLVEARRSRASMGGRQHDGVISRVTQERNAEMAAARRMGCFK